MHVRRNQSGGTVLAPAKLNLYLEVLGRRQDGYHRLQSLMVPIRLFDTISMRATSRRNGEPSGRLDFKLRQAYPGPRFSMPRGHEIPRDENNLVARALRLLQQRSNYSGGAVVRLIKRIPSGAGMGGGSSDAAAALVLANEVWQLRWTRAQLAEFAAELGSDVAFFLYDSAAICTGRGEQVQPLRGLPPLHFVVVKPPEELKTADVYGALQIPSDATAAVSERRVRDLVQLLRRGTWQGIGQRLCNRLEPAAATLSEWIERLRYAFGRLGFLGHQLTGSGSAYFGICRNARQARCLAATLRSQQLGNVYATYNCH